MVSSSLVVFLGVLVVGLVGAQAPAEPEDEVTSATKGCCTPPQYEALIGEMSSIRTRRRSMTVGEGMKLAYDATGKRVAVAGHVASRYGVHGFKVIKNYAQNKMYVITKQGCKTIATKSKFRPGCLPANSTSRGSVTMGAPRNLVRENIYEVRVKHMGASIAVTADRWCMPVSEFFGGIIIKRGHKGKHGRGRLVKVGISGAVNVFNVTIGIKDKKFFTPPASCKKEDDLEDMDLAGLSDEAIYMLYRHEELLDFPAGEEIEVGKSIRVRPGVQNKKELLLKKLAYKHKQMTMNQKEKNENESI